MDREHLRGFRPVGDATAAPPVVGSVVIVVVVAGADVVRGRAGGHLRFGGCGLSLLRHLGAVAVLLWLRAGHSFLLIVCTENATTARICSGEKVGIGRGTDLNTNVGERPSLPDIGLTDEEVPLPA